MKILFFSLLILCSHGYAQENNSKSSLLICHSYDPQSKEGRDKVKDLFVDLTDSLQRMMKTTLEENGWNHVQIIPARIEENFIVDSFSTLLDKYQCNTLVDISFLDVYFQSH
jgi:hypothetical protein